MTTLAIRPSVYYDAATTLHNAAASLFSEVDGRWTALSECAHMAGTYEEARAWAASYDQHVLDVSNLVVNTALALDEYAGVLRQLGYNHELAEHAATMGDSGAPPPAPASPPPAVYTCRVPIPSAGGPSNGLEDSGIKLAEKIGITVPNGDTAKLAQVGDVWDQLAKVAAVTALPGDIDRVLHEFTSVIDSPETEHIAADLATLRRAADDIGATFAALAGACHDHATGLHELREQLKQQLEDLGKELAKEVAITYAIGVAASLVTFGIGVAVASARVVEIAARFARPIRAIIDAWKERKKLKEGIKLERDLSKSQKDVQQLPKRGDSWNSANARGGLTDDERWILNRGPTDRNGHDLISAIREGKVTPQQQEDINAYNRALDKLPPYEGRVVRHTKLTDEQLAEYVPGQPKVEEGYTCTSTNPNGTNNGVGTGTADVEYRIVSKTGRQIGDYGGTVDEVQFKDHTRFFVHDKYPDPKTGRIVIVMDEM
ncbi:hypothetical protein GZH49_29380 [Nocardia terpenica]|uniref:hypothetical protein n=1 Tax=Nocardia terpenica TaxID=455432 RepID=UPI002FE244F5